MAKCDEGYRCEVCGEDVEDIRSSDLYLRFVIGELDPEVLHTTPERHIRCNPTLAQFILHEEFPPIAAGEVFAKQQLDPQYVQQREALVTRGWLRLQELASAAEEISLLEYPLPEMRGKYAGN